MMVVARKGSFLLSQQGHDATISAQTAAERRLRVSAGPNHQHDKHTRDKQMVTLFSGKLKPKRLRWKDDVRKTCQMQRNMWNTAR